MFQGDLNHVETKIALSKVFSRDGRYYNFQTIPILNTFKPKYRSIEYLNE